MGTLVVDGDAQGALAGKLGQLMSVTVHVAGLFGLKVSKAKAMWCLLPKGDHGEI